MITETPQHNTYQELIERVNVMVKLLDDHPRFPYQPAHWPVLLYSEAVRA